MRKKELCLSGLVLLILTLLLYTALTLPYGKGTPTEFRTAGKTVQQLQNGQWADLPIQGVNMGTGYPGLFPNDTGIPAEVYGRWFAQIADMNANALRVYKLQSPEFYRAFGEYNRTHEKKLYLLQGLDFPEPYMYTEEDLFHNADALFRDTLRTVDALHGRELWLDVPEGRLDWYLEDVSDYVMGYILGIEWDETFVEYVCRTQEHRPLYAGEYLSCRDGANAFESFLAQWGDTLLSYEDRHYGTQKLMSFCNWPETDALSNEVRFHVFREGEQDNSEARVDLEFLQAGEKLESGLFASYNVYPYFPAFLQHGEYTSYVDDQGRRNPYRKYLMELVSHHEMPVVVTEYGIPASGSQAYGEVWHHIPHGGLNETEQGEGLLVLLEDIEKAGCAGSIVFTWQDEWYKTMWNEKLLSDPDRRAYWSNALCAEQQFGLLSFEPGMETPYPDGDFSDWEGISVLTQGEGRTLKMQSDEKYVYFLVEGEDLEAFSIALDITPESGKTKDRGMTFSRPVDFILRMDGPEHSTVLVDPYYDLLAYSALGGYHDLSFSSWSTLVEGYLKDDGAFREVARADGDIYSHLISRWNINKVGKLRPGNGNPEAPDYDSNTDFSMTEQGVEIRIPWQMLNFADPSKAMIVDDYHETGYVLKNRSIDEFYVGLYDDAPPEEFAAYGLSTWEEPTWHERLKTSYYLLQEAFAHDHP